MGWRRRWDTKFLMKTKKDNKAEEAKQILEEDWVEVSRPKEDVLR